MVIFKCISLVKKLPYTPKWSILDSIRSQSIRDQVKALHDIKMKSWGISDTLATELGSQNDDNISYIRMCLICALPLGQMRETTTWDVIPNIEIPCCVCAGNGPVYGINYDDEMGGELAGRTQDQKENDKLNFLEDNAYLSLESFQDNIARPAMIDCKNTVASFKSGSPSVSAEYAIIGMDEVLDVFRDKMIYLGHCMQKMKNASDRRLNHFLDLLASSQNSYSKYRLLMDQIKSLYMAKIISK